MISPLVVNDLTEVEEAVILFGAQVLDGGIIVNRRLLHYPSDPFRAIAWEAWAATNEFFGIS